MKPTLTTLGLVLCFIAAAFLISLILLLMEGHW